MNQRRTLLALLSIASIWGPTGCELAPRGPLSVSAVDDTVRVLPDGPLPVQTDLFDDYSRRVALSAAINEVVAFQLVIRADAGTVDNVRIDVSDFTNDQGTIRSADAVRLFRQHVIRIARYPSWFLRFSAESPTPREYPDALVPLTASSGASLSIPPGRNVPVWVDVRVPPGTAPGLYRSTLRLTIAGAPANEVPLELTVWPIALPAVPEIAILAGVDLETLFARHLVLDGEPYAPRRLTPEVPLATEARALLAQTFSLLHDHRLSPYLKRFYPVVKVNADQGIDVDWDDYDSTIADFLDGTAFADRVPVAAWPLPIDRTVPTPPERTGGFSAVYNRNFVRYLQQCAEHFREKGWYDRHFIVYDPTYPTASTDVPTVVATPDELAFARRVETARVAGRFLAPYPPQDMTRYGWFSDAPQGWVEQQTLVSIFCPSVRWYDPREMTQQRAAGRQTWLIPDQPPFAGSLAIEADFLQARSLPWAAYRLGAQAILIPDVNAWSPRPFETVIEHPGQRSDAWLLYPGRFVGQTAPIPSVRLKQLRRGMQDHAYLQLLRQRGHADLADRMAGALVKRVGTEVYGDHLHDAAAIDWARRPHLWSLARHLMAGVLAENRDPADDTAALAARIEWTRFFSETASLEIVVEGVRVRPTTEGPLEVYVHVVLANRRSQPVSGHLRFTDLKSGWVTPVDRWAIVNLEPGHTRRVTMTARTDALAANVWGVEELHVRLEIENETPRDVTARLTRLTAWVPSEPLIIDGDLSDWPAGAGNVAGDFLLIRTPDGSADPIASRRAPSRTAAFVCRDRDNLYFAINCMDVDPAGPIAEPSNRVRYDRTMPVGEDLVEIVIDPTNGGTGSTGDLFHIVVKANGAVLAERGIGWQPPTGPRRIWSVDIKAAVSTPPGQWHIEVAVPLAAFPADARRQPVWGIDFARFDPRTGTYTTWSGTTRHPYNPRGLGNMAW